MSTVTEETASLSSLLPGTALVPALLLLLVAFYVARSLWIARRVWPQCRTDTKILYLLVAPALTLAVDLLEITDRLFWSRGERAGKGARYRVSPPLRRPAGLRPKTALRSNG